MVVIIFLALAYGSRACRTKPLWQALVTQPMLQLRPNCTELRSLDYYHQICCRFQKCKRKVPPPSLLNNEKSPFTPPKGEKNLPLGG